MKETIISPDSGLGSIKATLLSMVKNLGPTWELARRMFLRDIRAMHRQSILGYAWIILPPLANSLVWIFLNQQQVLNIDTKGTPYPVFVLTGNLLWAAFNSAIVGLLGAVNEARNLISKINFPHESLLLSAFMKAAFNGLIPLIILIPILPFYLSSLHWQMLLFPIGVLSLLAAGSTIAILLLPIATLYTDIGKGIQLILRFGFFLTPVIYPMPEHGLARIIAEINPITPLLITSRSWLIGGELDMLLPFWCITLTLPLLLIVSVIIFKITVPYLVERLSA
ncbi:ABC transporter permease [Cerasicoccus fimbriatus]|uniref:ABC transporter permease n=1 Tax=Cerasicoccus fimbriatus TaxID=3014554 RepID=UPI0022B52E36|nr:ABC transporter permease [Cerasicoccus sp. TK19100]